MKPSGLEPLLRALQMPRVGLFIADDVVLRKRIEAGLILGDLAPRFEHLIFSSVLRPIKAMATASRRCWSGSIRHGSRAESPSISSVKALGALAWSSDCLARFIGRAALAPTSETFCISFCFRREPGAIQLVNIDMLKVARPIFLLSFSSCSLEVEPFCSFQAAPFLLSAQLHCHGILCG
jgi:hypothetical protein